jgi:hypothetical protein
MSRDPQKSVASSGAIQIVWSHAVDRGMDSITTRDRALHIRTLDRRRGPVLELNPTGFALSPMAHHRRCARVEPSARTDTANKGYDRDCQRFEKPNVVVARWQKDKVLTDKTTEFQRVTLHRWVPGFGVAATTPSPQETQSKNEQ